MADDHGHGEEHGKKKKGHGKGHGGGDHGGGHHEEGVPEWVVSFADNVMLMMGFFVIMLAMNMHPKDGGAGEEKRDGATNSSVDNPAVVDFAIEVRNAFNNPVKLDSTKPADQPLIRRIREKQSAGRSSDKAPDGNKDSVESIRASDFYSPAGSVPFADGADDLTGSARKACVQIAESVRGPNFVIEIRGYVSAMESKGDQTAARLLSYRRAMAVARALADAKIPWERMRLVAVGDGDRITPLAYDAKAHRTNQRVEVLVTKEVVQEDPHLREQEPALEDTTPEHVPSKGHTPGQAGADQPE